MCVYIRFNCVRMKSGV